MKYHKYSYKSDRGRSDTREGDGATKAETEEMWPVAGGSEEKVFLRASRKMEALLTP